MITLATIFLLSHFFGRCVQIPKAWIAEEYGFPFMCPAGMSQPRLCCMLDRISSVIANRGMRLALHCDVTLPSKVAGDMWG